MSTSDQQHHRQPEPKTRTPALTSPISLASFFSRDYHYPFASNACLKLPAPSTHPNVSTITTTNTTTNTTNNNNNKDDKMPTGASTASANSSHISLPGTLSSALSWTFNRWSSGASSTRAPSTSSSSVWGTGSTTLHPENNTYSSHRSSYPPSQPTSRPPSQRRASPFQPPPLPSLTLQGYSSGTTHLLTPILAEEIRQLIPARLQLYDSWSLVYSLEQHGVSLQTLYQRCAKKEFAKGGFVLVVKDDVGGVFGAFVNEEFKVSAGRYYGTGECFLWKAGWVQNYKAVHAQSNGSGHHQQQQHLHIPHLHHQSSKNLNGHGWDKNEASAEQDLIEPLSEKTNNSNERPLSRVGTPASIMSTASSTNGNVLKFKAFPYSGINEYFILCEQGFLSVGGGNGKFGLWFDNNFEKGVSSTCPTFGNEPLSDDGEKFEIIGVEVWSIGGSSF